MTATAFCSSFCQETIPLDDLDSCFQDHPEPAAPEGARGLWLSWAPHGLQEPNQGRKPVVFLEDLTRKISRVTNPPGN